MARHHTNACTKIKLMIKYTSQKLRILTDPTCKRYGHTYLTVPHPHRWYNSSQTQPRVATWFFSKSLGFFSPFTTQICKNYKFPCLSFINGQETKPHSNCSAPTVEANQSIVLNLPYGEAYNLRDTKYPPNQLCPVQSPAPWLDPATIAGPSLRHLQNIPSTVKSHNNSMQQV
jgi:hypothetical protein